MPDQRRALVTNSLITVRPFEAAGRPGQIWTFNNPEARNPVDAPTMRALRTLLTEACGASELGALVLTGAGEAFSAGGDLKKYRQLFRDRDALQHFMEDFE